MDYAFSDEVFISTLLAYCDIDSIESLRQVNTAIHGMFDQVRMISIMCKTLKINKNIASFYQLIQEYNHRYRRENSFEDDEDYHLQWAIDDNDIETFRSILRSYSYPKDMALLDSKKYNHFLTMGMNNYSEFFTAMLLEGFSDDNLDLKIAYWAGLSYSGKLLDVVNMTDITINSEEKALLVFEATRGKNECLARTLKHGMDEGYYTRAILFGAVASDNVEYLSRFLVVALASESYRYIRIKLLEHSDHIGWVDTLSDDGIGYTIIDELIVFALHYKSLNVLEYLTRDYSISPLFRSSGFYISDYDVWVYQWINSKIQFTDEGNQGILQSALCNNNLELVKELRRYHSEDFLLTHFDEMVDLNAYKTLKWVLDTYKYNKSLIMEYISTTVQDDQVNNYAKNILHRYLKSFD